MENRGNFGAPGGGVVQCDHWHTFAIAQITHLSPNLVIVTQESHPPPDNHPYASDQWRMGLDKFFASITVRGVQFAVIGNIPQLPEDPPRCLYAHTGDLPACSAPRAKSIGPYLQAEKSAVESVGGR